MFWNDVKYWFLPPPPERDERFRRAKAWYDAFDPKPTGRGALILDQARLKYAEQRAAKDALDAKAESLLRFAAGVLAVVLTAAVSLRLHPIGLALPALVCLIAAMVLALIARNPFEVPSMPVAKSAIDGVPQTEAPEEWLAAGLFWVTEELRVFIDWKGRMVQRATIVLSLGVILLLLLIGMRPS